MKTKSLLLIVTAIIAATLPTIAQTIPSYVPTNGLVAWYPFNGNAIDESINTNDGTVNGAILTTDRFGNANRAYYFNGTSNKIALPNLGNLTEFSFSIWVKSDGENGVASRGFFGSSGFWTVGHLHAGATNADLSVGLADNGTNNPVTTTSYKLNNLNWTNVTYTFKSSNNVYLYINGVEVDNVPANSVTTLFNSLTVGYNHNTNRYWNGKIDDLGFWNRVLTQAEITKLYGSNTTGLKETFEKESINIFPNPAKSKLHIEYNNYTHMNGYTIKITNPLGKNVYTSSINQSQLDIDLLNLSGSGIYFITTEDELNNIVDVRKVLIQ